MNQANSQNKYPDLAKEWFLRAQDDELSSKDILTEKELLIPFVFCRNKSRKKF